MSSFTSTSEDEDNSQDSLTESVSKASRHEKTSSMKKRDKKKPEDIPEWEEREKRTMPSVLKKQNLDSSSVSLASGSTKGSFIKRKTQQSHGLEMIGTANHSVLDRSVSESDDRPKKVSSPKKMRVHFSNTLEVIHDIRDSPPEDSEQKEEASSGDSKRTASDYSSDFESGGTGTTEKYTSDFDSSDRSHTFSGYTDSFSEASETFQSDQRTLQLDSSSVFSDGSDTCRDVSDSASYTDSQYSDLGSLTDDSSDDLITDNDPYSDTFESTPTKSRSNKSSSEYRYDDESFEETDTSSIKQSLLDSLVFPDLSDIETTDVMYAREQFIGNLIYKLKHEDIKLDFELPDSLPQVKTESRTERRLRDYCRRKIDLIKSKKNVPSVPVKTRRGHVKQTQSVPVETYGIGSHVVDRLRLQNLMMRLKKQCEEEIHDINTCPTCINKSEEVESALLKKDFIRKMKLKVESEMMDDKIQKHLIEMNSVNLIAKIIKEIPKLSEDSRETLYTYKQKVEGRIVPS